MALLGDRWSENTSGLDTIKWKQFMLNEKLNTVKEINSAKSF
jgi:hypothetical protein